MDLFNGQCSCTYTSNCICTCSLKCMRVLVHLYVAALLFANVPAPIPVYEAAHTYETAPGTIYAPAPIQVYAPARNQADSIQFMSCNFFQFEFFLAQITPEGIPFNISLCFKLKFITKKRIIPWSCGIYGFLCLPLSGIERFSGGPLCSNYQICVNNKDPHNIGPMCTISCTNICTLICLCT